MSQRFFPTRTINNGLISLFNIIIYANPLFLFGQHPAKIPDSINLPKRILEAMRWHLTSGSHEKYEYRRENDLSSPDERWDHRTLNVKGIGHLRGSLRALWDVDWPFSCKLPINSFYGAGHVIGLLFLTFMAYFERRRTVSQAFKWLIKTCSCSRSLVEQLQSGSFSERKKDRELMPTVSAICIFRDVWVYLGYVETLCLPLDRLLRVDTFQSILKLQEFKIRLWVSKFLWFPIKVFN